jgi:predicted unusual protein kinase regulating ubiquinone biosynthesis (AarF/ABC1/UbiB family)
VDYWELSRLQDAVPPFPYEQVQAIILSELGGLYLKIIYSEFDPIPAPLQRRLVRFTGRG